MTAWPPTYEDGTLDRRAADTQLLRAFGTSIDRLVDLNSVVSEAHASAERARTADDPGLAISHIGVVVAALDQARRIGSATWDNITSLEGAFQEVLSFADIERRRAAEDSRIEREAAS